MQRDRLMTGVGFAHFDQEWLFNCLEVGSVTIGSVKDDEDVIVARCLYLGPKGLQVAEEYLEARFRLYSMVYMHKTTRAAEQMLSALLSTVGKHVKTGKIGSAERDAVSRYLALETPDLDSYLALDDAAIWTFMESLSKSATGPEQQLARRLLHRCLYKCVDIGVRDEPKGNLYIRERRSSSLSLARLTTTALCFFPRL